MTATAKIISMHLEVVCSQQHTLRALSIELWRVGLVKSEQLMADQVVARSK